MAKLNDGFNIHVIFGTSTELVLCATSVKDPGFALGDSIDITTNCTVGAREKAPSNLGEATTLDIVARYDPADREKLMAAIGVPQTITVEYRTAKNRAVGEKVTYTGAWLASWEPSEMTIGEMPTLSATIELPGGTSTGDGSDYHPEGEYDTIAVTP